MPEKRGRLRVRRGTRDFQRGGRAQSPPQLLFFLPRPRRSLTLRGRPPPAARGRGGGALAGARYPPLQSGAGLWRAHVATLTKKWRARRPRRTSRPASPTSRLRCSWPRSNCRLSWCGTLSAGRTMPLCRLCCLNRGFHREALRAGRPRRAVRAPQGLPGLCASPRSPTCPRCYRISLTSSPRRSSTTFSPGRTARARRRRRRAHWRRLQRPG